MKTFGQDSEETHTCNVIKYAKTILIIKSLTTVKLMLKLNTYIKSKTCSQVNFLRQKQKAEADVKLCAAQFLRSSNVLNCCMFY